MVLLRWKLSSHESYWGKKKLSRDESYNSCDVSPVTMFPNRGGGGSALWEWEFATWLLVSSPRKYIIGDQHEKVEQQWLMIAHKGWKYSLISPAGCLLHGGSLAGSGRASVNTGSHNSHRFSYFILPTRHPVSPFCLPSSLYLQYTSYQIKSDR